MELDDLKTRWEAQDRKLDAVLRLNARALDAAARRAAGPVLRPLAAGLVVELVLNALLVLLTGSFLADNVATPRFAIPGAFLHLVAIGLLGTTIRQLVFLRAVDWSAPVLDLQRRIAAVRLERVRTIAAIFLLSPLLWAMLFVVAFRLVGVDAWSAFGVRYVAGNVAFGLVALAAGAWAAQSIGARASTSSRARAFVDALAGRQLARAAEEVAALARFEETEAAAS